MFCFDPRPMIRSRIEIKMYENKLRDLKNFQPMGNLTMNQRTLLKNGKPHPELICPDCTSALFIVRGDDRKAKHWACSDRNCRWNEKADAPK